jgi:hypothetical protein
MSACCPLYYHDDSCLCLRVASSRLLSLLYTTHSTANFDTTVFGASFTTNCYRELRVVLHRNPTRVFWLEKRVAKTHRATKCQSGWTLAFAR